MNYMQVLPVLLENSATKRQRKQQITLAQSLGKEDLALSIKLSLKVDWWQL